MKNIKPRIVKVKRETKETNIDVTLNLDGVGRYEIETPIGFFNHMLELFSKQGLFDLEVKASGDIKVDEHHLVEDMGIVLGQAFLNALGEKRGIKRFGFFILPMDEVLATVAVDLCGRFNFNFQCKFKRKKAGDLPTDLVYEFWNAFAQNARMSLFIRVENGRNDHHAVEAIYKSVAQALRMACEADTRLINGIPSTKGVL